MHAPPAPTTRLPAGAGTYSARLIHPTDCSTLSLPEPITHAPSAPTTQSPARATTKEARPTRPTGCSPLPLREPSIHALSAPTTQSPAGGLANSSIPNPTAGSPLSQRLISTRVEYAPTRLSHVGLTTNRSCYVHRRQAGSRPSPSGSPRLARYVLTTPSPVGDGGQTADRPARRPVHRHRGWIRGVVHPAHRRKGCLLGQRPRHPSVGGGVASTMPRCHNCSGKTPTIAFSIPDAVVGMAVFEAAIASGDYSRVAYDG